MLFGEKYEDVVRMIQFDTSKELCGGTHVNATGEIGLFKIISEGSTSSGVRRIEALTGIQALSYFNEKVSLVHDLANLIKTKDLSKAVKHLMSEKKELEKQIIVLKKANFATVKESLLDSVVQLNEIRFIGQEVKMDANDMKTISFMLRNEKNLAVVLASKSDNKAFLSIMLTDDLVGKGLSAGVIINKIAKEIEGGGGGQSFFATAGGTKVSGITDALIKARKLFK